MTEPTATIPNLPAPPIDSIVELTRDLIRIPSRGGEDPCGPIVDAVSRWLDDHGVPTRVLESDPGNRVAVIGEVSGGAPDPTYVLDACLDTAPYGDLGAWHSPPDDPRIHDGWLYGRGAADSKVAVAIFSHVAAALQQQRESLAGRLLVLFDADEHTGRFAGVKTFVRHYPDVAGVMIGYPGNYGVVVGARGFYRATVTLYGIGGHSGGRRAPYQNVIEKAAEFVRLLGQTIFPEPTDAAFPLAPSLTVTAIHGGLSFSMVPDSCTLNVDIRLTPGFGADDARLLLQEAIAAADEQQPGRVPGSLAEQESWPAYRLAEEVAVARALIAAARTELDPAIGPVVCGPSNVGNYFAAHRIAATCGFGVRYEDLHAPNERILIETIPVVYRSYAAATMALVGTGAQL